jgi:PAS domain S-box-containing protein/putative nucleotidyltransferase with HDIG domain
MRQRPLQVLEQRSQVTSRSAAVDGAELREGDARYRELVDHLHLGVVIYEATAGGEDFIIRDFNPAAARLEKTAPQAVIGRPLTEAIPGVGEFGLLDVLRRVWKTGRAERHPIWFYQDQRLAGWRENYVYRLPSGLLVAVYDDVTESMLAEELLSKYRLLTAEARDIMLFVTTGGAIVGANAAAEAAYGYSREELLRLHIDALRPARDGPMIDRQIRAAGVRGTLFETEHRRKDGSFFPVEVSVSAMALLSGDEVHLSVVRDISERKQAEDALRRSEERYRILTEASPDFIYLIDRQDRVQYVNSRAAQAVGRSPEEIVGKLRADLFDAESAAHMEAALKCVFESGEARESESQMTYSDGRAWLATWLVPIKDDKGHVSAVFGVSRDISERRRAGEALAQGALQSKLALKAAVAALGSTAELRDPYTAGHQRRVAELAGAIAAELGWGEAQIESLRTAALLHDIGKIVVPAEILSKPGRLTEIEMQLIRQHAAAGADTVADIDFEGAVAEMIRQHHERLDGSGYPAGLKSAQILPEARVLAVADVVEAMSSHRPYRPALPIEEALSEIESGAGTRYDAEACAACIRLFREQGFALSA